MKTKAKQPTRAKTETERALDAVDTLLLKLERDLLARSKEAGRKRWYVQALTDDIGAMAYRNLYRTEMYTLRRFLGARQRHEYGNAR